MRKAVNRHANQDRTPASCDSRSTANRAARRIFPQEIAVLAFHGGFTAVLSASAMRTLVLLLAALVVSGALVEGEIKTPQNAPIEITSTGETTYENGLATARDNVAIHIGNTDIYADYAQYNPATHEVLLRGNVRIYRDTRLYIDESGIYNSETKKIKAFN